MDIPNIHELNYIYIRCGMKVQRDQWFCSWVDDSNRNDIDQMNRRGEKGPSSDQNTHSMSKSVLNIFKYHV